MKLGLNILMAMFLLGCSTSGNQVPRDEGERFPVTINEAVDIIVGGMTDEDKIQILGKSRDDLIIYHHGWGTGIRNEFGLWRGNTALLDDCGGSDIHPDACSMIIIEAVWERLRGNYPREELEKIDRINDALSKIRIAPYRHKDSGMIEYISFLNSQIEKSPYSKEFTITAKCASDDYRLKDFYSENEKSLSNALGYIRGQYLAAIKVIPGRIELEPLPFLGSKQCITK